MSREQNVEMLKTVAKNLNPLFESEKTVFVGGAVVSLLMTDLTAPNIRATNDVDIVISVKTRLKYNKMEQKLRDAGFKQMLMGGIICRWIIKDIIVDIMPTDEDILGFSNRWYPAAIKQSSKYSLDGNTTINLISRPCFLATKMEAFRGRGDGDFIMSHDIEDIINLIDGCPELANDIQSATTTLKKFLVQRFRLYLKNHDFHDAIKGCLVSETDQARYPIIIQRIEEISNIGY